MPLIGAHVSAAVELPLSLERARQIGAECTQIFISPPRQWSQINHPPKEIEDYKKKSKAEGILPNFIHGTYLINLATENPEHLKKSVEWLKYGLDSADQLEMAGVIFHTGSHRGRGFKTVQNQIRDSLAQVLKNSPSKPYLIIETTAGAGGGVGNFEEIGELIKGVSDKRLRVCLDTQHTFALGYDLVTKQGIDKTLEEFNSAIGLENLVVIHCSDSKVEKGAFVDRHENIGEGFIGDEGFRNLLNNPTLKSLPFILEVPGFSGNGPDKENVDKLHSLMSKI